MDLWRLGFGILKKSVNGYNKGKTDATKQSSILPTAADQSILSCSGGIDLYCSSGGARMDRRAKR